MATSKPAILQKLEFDEAAQVYLKSLTIENIMEADQQGQQRIITVNSLSQILKVRPDVHLYNELLVQYRLRVCPDEILGESGDLIAP